eukprot:1189993-Prorocentrum_minimum.AAC.1
MSQKPLSQSATMFVALMDLLTPPTTRSRRHVSNIDANPPVRAAASAPSGRWCRRVGTIRPLVSPRRQLGRESIAPPMLARIKRSPTCVSAARTIRITARTKQWRRVSRVSRSCVVRAHLPLLLSAWTTRHGLTLIYAA